MIAKRDMISLAKWWHTSHAGKRNSIFSGEGKMYFRLLAASHVQPHLVDGRVIDDPVRRRAGYSDPVGPARDVGTPRFRRG